MIFSEKYFLSKKEGVLKKIKNVLNEKVESDGEQRRIPSGLVSEKTGKIYFNVGDDGWYQE